jgi:hypothetical protein
LSPRIQPRQPHKATNHQEEEKFFRRIHAYVLGVLSLV